MLAGKFDVANFVDCSLMFLANSNDTLESRMGNVYTTGTNLLVNTNHYMASSRSKSDGSFYTSFDNTVDSQIQDIGLTTEVDATIGTGWSDETMTGLNRQFSGIISEVRISLSNFLSDDWVITERNNLTDVVNFAEASIPTPL